MSTSAVKGLQIGFLAEVESESLHVANQTALPMADRSQQLMNLKPVTFHYKQDPNGELQYGLIAEQVAQVYPELAVKDSDGQIQTIRYQELTPMLLNEV